MIANATITVSQPGTAQQLPQGRYTITRYRVTLEVHAASAKTPAPETSVWIPLEKIAELPMASPHRRALEAVLQGN